MLSRINPGDLNTPADNPALQPEISDARPDEKENEYIFDVADEPLTDIDIALLFPYKALEEVGYHDEIKREDARVKLTLLFQKQHFRKLAAYTYIKGLKAYTYAATPDYPLFVITEEGGYHIIYQPLCPDEKLRYTECGRVPKSFMHGLGQIDTENQRRVNQNAENTKQKEADPENASSVPADEDPVKEAIIVPEPAQALGLALMGYYPLYITGSAPWISDYEMRQLGKGKYNLRRVYHVWHWDEKERRRNHRLALEHLELFNIELPHGVRIKTDANDEVWKPVRTIFDYLDWQNKYQLDQMLKSQALPYMFWGREQAYTGSGAARKPTGGYKYDFKSTRTYNFLNKMGFFRMNVEGRKNPYIFVYRDGNIIREKISNDVKNYIHDFLEERNADEELRDTMYESPRLGDASLSNLKEIEFDFKDNDERQQFLFFNNGSVEVTGKDIKLHPPGEIDRYVWEYNVIEHDFVKTDPPFRIWQLTDGSYDIEVLHTKCMFFNVMIQTSRMHWRRELEEELPKKYPKKEDQEKYLEEHRYEIAGELLKDEERWEQKQHLINKIFTYGYAIHQYKSPSRAWAVVCTDAKLSHNDKSNGRTGKSLIFNKSLRYVFSMRSIHKIAGTAPEVVKNPHVFHGLDKTKKVLIIDDADKNLPFRFFFEFISGDQVVNNKNGDIVTVADDDLCKMIWLTNYIFSTDSSMEGRIIYSVFSDYYHIFLETGEYKETRSPATEFGRDLFKKFDDEEFNYFYNTVAYCTQFFLSTPVKVKLNPPMSNVMKRRYLKDMGQEFEQWSSLYFNDLSNNKDRLIVKAEAMKEFSSEYDAYKKISSQWFKKALEAYCKINGYVLNPEELHNDWSEEGRGRIVAWLPKRQMGSDGTWYKTTGMGTQELFYIQTKMGEPLNRTKPGDEPFTPPAAKDDTGKQIDAF